MCADTNDGNINLLSLEAAHKTNMYKNMTLDEIKNDDNEPYVLIIDEINRGNI